MTKMSQNTDLFKKIDFHKAPPELGSAIFARIETEKVRIARRRFIIVSVLAVVALVSCVPAYKYAGATIASSGFSDYLSALFSSAQAMSHWKEFAMSLLDSLPVLGVSIFMTSVLAFISSLYIAIKNASVARFNFRFA